MSSSVPGQDAQMASPNAPTTNGIHHNGHSVDMAQSDLSDEDIPLSQSVAMSTPVRPSRNKRKAPVISDSSSDEDVPLASSPAKSMTSSAVPMPGAFKATTVPAPKMNGNGKPKTSKTILSDDDYDGDDSAKPSKSSKTKRPPKKKPKVEDSDGDDIKPPKKPANGSRKRKVTTTDPKDEPGDEASKQPKKPRKAVKKEEDEQTLPNGKGKAKAENGGQAPESPSKKGKKKAKEEDEEQEEIHRWWEAEGQGDGTQKWTTLEHNGVFFPPPYEPLPSSVKMKYKGQTVDLPPEAEEVAGFYGALLMTDHAQDATFNKNFFSDWLTVLKKYPPRDGTKITNFDDCDFRPLYEYFEAEKAKKKAMTSAEKKELKKAKDEMEAPYKTCLLDGRKETVGNFRIEPPGLFRGRGDHPRKGALKLRVAPEDITINIGKDAPIPKPNIPGKWGDVQHDNTVTWLANWTENVNGNHKYVFLAANSSLKGQSDRNKFEKARELKNHIDRIRLNYRNDLKTKVMADRQRATAMYFIDKLALRAGNEKGEDEADTVGCCSLRCEHVTLKPPHFLVFDFLGKDSIRYYKEVEVEPQIFKNVRIFKENKDDDDNLFDRVTTTSLNKHLTSEMKGLTAKVFRTFNASYTFQELLDNDNLEGKTVQEKLNAYNRANRLVAILCNHHRTVPKTFSQSMEKMENKLRALKYDRMKLRHILFGLDKKYKKDPKYSEDESDLDDDFIEQYEEECKIRDIEKAEKKFVKDNEKLEGDGKAPMKESELKEKIAAIESQYKELVKERGTGKAADRASKPRSEEKLEESISKLDEKIRALKLQMVDRNEGKEIALSTSKINYLDPRITAAWCKANDFPIEKIFSKSLLSKFPWAMEVDADWKF